MFSRIKRIEPGPGQESVWDYPRPPRVDDTSMHIRIMVNDIVLVDSQNAKRLLETSHPPTYYFPPEDIQIQYLEVIAQKSFCEWKGIAGYYDVRVGDRHIPQAAWFYAEPVAEYAGLQNYVAFYPGKMDECTVDGEVVQAQAGDFYGGWVTSDIVGPFKGGAGTWGW